MNLKKDYPLPYHFAASYYCHRNTGSHFDSQIQVRWKWTFYITGVQEVCLFTNSRTWASG